MGYRHWRLGKGDAYQLGVARSRLASLLEAHVRGVEGPAALACEVPGDGFEEWDDIAEFGVEAGGITATHYQVKLQRTDFKAGEREDTFKKLFERAARNLGDGDPYEGLAVPPDRRRFRLVLPTDDLSVGADLGIDQLRAMLEECTGTAADTIAANEGARLDGKGDGAQKRAWLKLIRAAAGTNDACARLLRQMRVEVRSPVEVEEGAMRILAARFEDATRARLLMDAALRDTAPEGWLDAEELLPKVADARPRPELRQVRLAQAGGAFFAQPYTRQNDVRAVSRSIVARAWDAPGAAEMHVGYPPPDASASTGARELRLACVRLILHAARSPVHVTGHAEWWRRSSAEVGGALAVAARNSPLEVAHYAERAAPGSLPPRAKWSPAELAEALHSAMDASVWERVRREGKAALAGAEGVPFEELAASMEALKGFFERILRGWWGLERDVSGVARAGPDVAPHVARIVAGVAVLRRLGFDVGAPDGPGSIATLGALPVRALAIDKAAVMKDREPAAAALSEHASDVLTHPGIVLVVGKSVDDFYELARMSPIDEPGGTASLQDGVPSAFLMDADSLVTAAKRGDEAARTRVRGWCDHRARQHRAVLDAALQRWGESNAA